MPRLPSNRKPLHGLFRRGDSLNTKKNGLRIPFINTLPHRKIKKRDYENRGKFSKFKSQNEREKDINSGLRLSNAGYYSTDFCFNCGAYSDEAFVSTPQYDVVCTKCAAVQPSETFFENAIDSAPKPSSAYKERTYLSERLRQFGNHEPRIPREDIRLIGQIYSELDTRYSKVVNKEEDPERQAKELKRLGLHGWFIDHPGNIGKGFIQTLLTLIDKTINPKLRGITKSFKKKYLERWLQIKIFLCGETYYKNSICSLPTEDLLTSMLLLSCQTTSVFKNKKEEAGIGSEKRSVPNVDLMFLLILYNIDVYYLRQFGWYFLSQAVKDGVESSNPNSAIKRDYHYLSKIFKYLNSEYKHRNPVSDKFVNCLEKGSWHLPEEKGGLVEIIRIAKEGII